jgi:hypothetical protein
MSSFLTNIARIPTNQVYEDNVALGTNTPRLPLKKKFSFSFGVGVGEKRTSKSVHLVPNLVGYYPR